MIHYKNLILLVLLFAGLGCRTLAQSPKTAKVAYDGPAILWKPRQLDVGNIPYGVPLTRDFVVENHSDSLLRITKVRTGCHCTTAEWTMEPIAPGSAGVVHVTFDALREEEFYKVIIVFTNQDAEQPMGLIFKGIVEKK